MQLLNLVLDCTCQCIGKYKQVVPAAPPHKSLRTDLKTVPGTDDKACLIAELPEPGALTLAAAASSAVDSAALGELAA